VRLRYTVRKRGNLFWQPTPEMRALGFEPKALGPDGPEAHAAALKLASAWDEARTTKGPISVYPAGSFGEFYDRFKRTTTWAKKGLRTREDYERAWKHIDAWRPAASRPTLSRHADHADPPRALRELRRSPRATQSRPTNGTGR
jgi:hypothetical protein